MDAVRVRRGMVAVVAVVVLAPVLVGCGNREQPTPVAAGAPRPSRVLLVGDSLLFQSRNTVVDALRARGWHATVDGRPGSAITGGYTIGNWPKQLGKLVRQTKPDVVVVELGTNGCGTCFTIDAGIDAVMQKLHGVRTVYWVNVKDNSPIPPDPEAINDALQWATRRYSNLHVIDMNRRFDHHPELLIPDHIHFNEAGIGVFARMIAAALPNES
jgi:lysophospholipase L1-like esterase